jgi:Sulfotransferase family
VSGTGVYITGASGTVTNNGTINGMAYGIGLGHGGSVTNTSSTLGGEVRRIRGRQARGSYPHWRALSGRTHAAIGRAAKHFFISKRLQILPRAEVGDTPPKPIFILGFPRSGTTLVEQTLSAHPRISACDELPLVNE